MRTARVMLDQYILLEQLGIKDFNGVITSIGVTHGYIMIELVGEDSRLPDSDKYPRCLIECTKIQSHFEEVK